MREGWLPDKQARYIEIGGLRIEETLEPDGARFVISGQRATSTELAYLARQLVGWFTDDPGEAIALIRAQLSPVIDELEEWNERARADVEEPLYNRMTERLHAAFAAIERLERVFSERKSIKDHR